VTVESLTAEMDRALQFPGVSNAWTMPIRARIDMLSTGIRTPVGIKVMGTDLVEIERLAKQIEQVVKAVPGTSSAYAERALGGYYLDVTPDRAALARYGIMIQDVQDVIATALGGQTVTTTVEGRQRFSVNMRYPRDLRSNAQAMASDVLVPMPNGGAVPLGEVAKIAPSRGPTSIRTENGQLAVYIYVDIRDRDLGGYVADAQAAVKASIQFPAGSYVVWSGQFEYLERAAARLKIVVPVTLLIIFLLLYLNFRSFADTMIVMLSLPFALVGGIWLMWWLGFNLSVAVVVGFIALAGVAAETGVVMLMYLNQALAEIRARREAEDDDSGCDHGRPAADHVEHRHRLGDHAADRGADDRWHGLVDPADADRDSRDLWAGQGKRPQSRQTECTGASRTGDVSIDQKRIDNDNDREMAARFIDGVSRARGRGNDCCFS